jgi:hypothetical protein
MMWHNNPYWGAASAKKSCLRCLIQEGLLGWAALTITPAITVQMIQGGQFWNAKNKGNRLVVLVFMQCVIQKSP